ncbi:MAG: GIY-YIG nuclease family protein, partial [Gemmatimonadales bacterium]
MEKAWFCYMLRCRDGSLSAGITNDLTERLKEHARAKDSEYTAKRLPVRLVWTERFSSRAEARRREVE